MGESKVGRKKRAIARAEFLRDNLPLVHDLEPAPCELSSPVEIDCIDSYRYLDCPGYQKCLDISSLAGWEALNCRACPVHRQYGKDKDLPKVRNTK